MRRVISGKNKGELALIPFTNTIFINGISISTRVGNMKVNWVDGSSSSYSVVKNVDLTTANGTSISHSYDSVLNDSISINVSRLSDVYSFSYSIWNNSATQITKLNIQDFGSFIKQFSNLYSFKLYHRDDRGNHLYFPIIKGNLLDVGASVERIEISVSQFQNYQTNLIIDLGGLPIDSKLKWFSKSANTNGSNLKIIGDLSKLPVTCSFFHAVSVLAGSSITYTAGKVWASAFGTLNLPMALTTAQTNDMLSDMAASITSAIGGKLIKLNGNRSAASDVAVAYLQSLGFTVQITRI